MKKIVLVLLTVLLSFSIFGCSAQETITESSIEAAEQTATLSPTHTVVSTPTPTVKAIPTPTPEPVFEEEDTDADSSAIVYVTDSGQKYHSGGCQYLSKSKIEISLEEAVTEGYTPCSKCSPPVLIDANTLETITPEPTIEATPEPTQVIEEPPQEEPVSETVYITKTGEKYHRDGCQYLSKSQIPISKNDAIAEGYTPCSRCNP